MPRGKYKRRKRRKGGAGIGALRIELKALVRTAALAGEAKAMIEVRQERERLEKDVQEALGAGDPASVAKACFMDEDGIDSPRDLKDGG